MIEIIENNILTHVPGNRSNLLRHIQGSMKDQGKSREIAEIILMKALRGIHLRSPLISICQSLIQSVSKELSLDMSSYSEGNRVVTGIRMINYMDGYVLPSVEEMVKHDGSVDFMTILKSSSDEVDNLLLTYTIETFELDPTQGPREWTGFTMEVCKGHHIDFVKKARRYNLQHSYTLQSIPEVYRAVNKLQRTGFRINEALLSIARDFPFIPPIISDSEKNKAISSIARLKKRARTTNTVNHVVESEWYQEKHEIVSEWSKRRDYDEVMKRATQWAGETLHFVYTLDSRSRMYPLASRLNPQGNDLSKALLVFEKEYPFNAEDFAVITANHAGRDKLSFTDRVQWVQDNIDDIIAVGSDPLGNYDILKAWGVDEEEKSRWQFVACCIEWHRYWSEGTPEDFTTSIPFALDMTCSALQIATVISRDKSMAEHVNLVKQDKPGDIYKVSAMEAIEELKKIDEPSKGIQLAIEHPSPRKWAKRPQMVADYSGTMKGMREMTYTDKSKTKLKGITKDDANIIGKVLYNVTNHESRGSTKIKNFLRSGINYYEGGSLLTWRTRDNFLCFQSADRSESQVANGMISGVKVHLTFYIHTGKPNKQKHKNLVCPNVTHSIDGTIVRYITNMMPEEAPLSMVHDSYATSSSYVSQLLPVVLEGLIHTGDRDWYEAMVASMIGHYRPLPSAGTLTLEQIREANYAIC